ncbi:MAG TPA: RNA 2',3'-cyclic phosphodiesterase [Pirellulales bacterium]|nr:RNA 2',3'-cyclic phosphodiesterase [Pirellulales bacterium]
MTRTLRTFVAVEISSETRARARQLIARLSGTGAKVSWVKPECLHLTLKFLGDVDLRDVAPLYEAVKSATAELPPFEIEVRGAGAFPTAARPRTLWLGVGRGGEELVALHDAVDQALDGLGYRREQRRFRPHLTIGRVRGGHDLDALGQLVTQHADFAGGVSSIDEVVVMSSDLTPDGPDYEPLAVAPLDGR